MEIAAQITPEVELFEELLSDPASAQTARRLQTVRRRLQAGMLASELVAGALGGAVLGVVAAFGELRLALAIAGSVLCWRALGSVVGICIDSDTRPWTTTNLQKAKTTIVMALAAAWIAFGALSALGATRPALAALVGASVAAITAIGGRGVAHARVYRSRELAQHTVIVGSGVVARQVVERLELAPHSSLKVIGLVDDDVNLETSPSLPHLGCLEDLETIIRRHDVDRVIIAFTRSGHDELLRCIRLCWDNRVAIDIVPRLFEFLDGARTLDQVGGLPMLSITVPQLSRSGRALKRSSDIVLGTLGLLFVSPLLLAVAALIMLDSPGSVFFRQRRVGRNGKLFDIYKFRSMYIDAEKRKRELAGLNDVNDGVMFKIHDDPRITRIGGFLRRFSIDELPQLINVIRGEMSLVGPRPLIPEEIAAFDEGWHRRRLDLRPGLTGPWQIYGRSDTPFQDMLRFDYQYVAGWSLGRDFEIILATVPVALSGRGAY